MPLAGRQRKVPCRHHDSRARFQADLQRYVMECSELRARLRQLDSLVAIEREARMAAEQRRVAAEQLRRQEEERLGATKREIERLGDELRRLRGE